MEFSQKLQVLRKQKGLTQEELAALLYVSRTAVSKWESGRGYPNIESLQRLAAVFSVTVDELLSGDQLLTLARQEQSQKQGSFLDLVFGLLDVCVGLLLFLPFFAQKTGELLQEVPLLQLTTASPYIKTVGICLVGVAVAVGVLTLALQNCKGAFWWAHKQKISLLCSAAGVLWFILSRQPYAAVFLFTFLILKVFLLAKKQ